MNANDYGANYKVLINEAKKELTPAEYLKHLYVLQGYLEIAIEQAQTIEPPKRVRGPNKAKPQAELPLNKED